MISTHCGIRGHLCALMYKKKNQWIEWKLQTVYLHIWTSWCSRGKTLQRLKFNFVTFVRSIISKFKSAVLRMISFVELLRLACGELWTSNTVTKIRHANPTISELLLVFQYTYVSLDSFSLTRHLSFCCSALPKISLWLLLFVPFLLAVLFETTDKAPLTLYEVHLYHYYPPSFHLKTLFLRKQKQNHDTFSAVSCHLTRLLQLKMNLMAVKWSKRQTQARNKLLATEISGAKQAARAEQRGFFSYLAQTCAECSGRRTCLRVRAEGSSWVVCGLEDFTANHLVPVLSHSGPVSESALEASPVELVMEMQMFWLGVREVLGTIQTAHYILRKAIHKPLSRSKGVVYPASF